MLNWFDLMRQSQGGAGLDNMARQFGLTPEQMGKAAAAAMPAFLMGLQRNATSPDAVQELFRLMGAGHYPAFFESAARAFTPQARQEGHALLNQLFGSDEVSRKVAQQAAAASGVGVEVLQQMLPLMAGIMAGGFATMAAASFASSPGGPTEPAPGQTGLGGVADFWSAMMPRPEKTNEPKPNSFDEMMTSFVAAQRGAAPPPKPQTPDPFAAFGQMIEKGKELQGQHFEALRSIFDGAQARPETPDDNTR